MSTRIGAMAGPQVLPRLAESALFNFAPRILNEIFSFLRENAVRTHPKRDRAYTRFTLGLRFAGARS
jgi:hypothetical protein